MKTLNIVLSALALLMIFTNAQPGIVVVPIVKKVAISWAGAWDTDQAYKKGDGIQYHGSSYLCLQDHTSSPTAAPPASEYWDLMAAKGETGTPIADMRCPEGESVVGFAAGVPLCTSDVIPRVVFVTASTHTGAIGGLAAADLICQNEATAANLSGKYIAFLSNSIEPGSTLDLINTNLANAKYVRPDNTVVANSTAEFLSLNHLAPMNIIASGAALTDDGRVWTGYLAADGVIESQPNPSITCSDWTAAIPSTGGANGVATDIDFGWVNDYGTYCTEAHHLYCVQVPSATAR